jgi:putative membrane protein
MERVPAAGSALVDFFTYPSKRISTAAMLLIFALTWVKPMWPYEQALHGSLTVVGFVLLWRYAGRYALTERDLFFIALFLSVHSVAARWLYSYVPYDAWIRAVFGFSVNTRFGWTRNHFDRLVHLMFGVCFTPVIAAHAMRRLRLRPMLAFYFAISAVMIVSLWYEWFEFAVAMTLSGKDAEAYNGQQGDPWDAHKDMLMATLGSLLWAWFYARENRKTPVVPVKIGRSD